MSTVYLGFLASFDARPEKEYILFWTDNYYYQRYFMYSIRGDNFKRYETRK